MKKNTMMRVASALLVAVLLTTCAISGTFAKYVTSEKAQDSARVAKFGVDVTATGNDAFAKNYKDEAGDAGLQVKSDVKVVAPGTEGTLGTVTVKGQPEVVVTVERKATLVLTGWEVDGDFYCPLTITVGTTPFKGTDYTSASEFQTAVLAAINKTTQYDAGTDLSTVGDDLAITWAWEFYTDDATDVLDTKLGDKAVAEDIKIEFSLEIIVTQVD